MTKIKSGKSEFNLNGLDSAEYPLLPQIEEHHVFKIPTDLLKHMMDKLYLQFLLLKQDRS